MSNYTKSTNFATKDNLPTGDPLKIVKGTEIDTEFNNIATAIATKTDNSAAAITGGSITGITDLAIADGGTGASTATAAINNLLPSQTSNANKYLQTDGTNVSWDAVSLSTSDITGTLPVANGGTGLSSLGTGITTFLGTPSSANLAGAVTDETGSGALVFANSPTLVTPALGTPSSATLTNATGLPLSTGITGLGTGVATALAINTPNTGAIVVNGGALGTPSSGTVTNLTGTANININGQVGSSTPNSGAFTTLNASSTVTLSGGTANGIAYLNGSKVLTTGSALTFNGVNLTSDRSTSTAYSGTTQSTWANGIVLNNNSTPATGIFNSIYFSNSANMINVFGVAQNASGYGDFVWSGYAGTYTEWMKLSSTGLTLTSNPTLSGGTANGVTYLNGSKVLTSGSALTFDGTNLGVGTSSPQTRFVVSNGSNENIEFFSGSVALNGGGFEYINRTTATTRPDFNYYLGINGAHKFYISGSEQMRLTSTGLGIGTSSPSYKLDVAGAARSDSWIGRSNTSAPTADAFIYRPTDNTIALGTANTERLRIDSAGNLGLGVTPSAWSSSYKAFQVAGQNFTGTTTQGLQTQNAYYDGTSWKYIVTAPANYLEITGGQYRWNVAPSGTAGNAITFTQAMSLLANGAWVLGDTSVVASGFAGVKFNGASFNGLGLNDSSATTGAGYIYFQSAGTTIGSITRVGATSAVAYNTSSDYRLKNTIAPMTGALAKVAQLKPVTYKWNADGSDGEGFIAHELAEVVPQCVTGQKDAVDAEGNPQYQGIDTSFLVATLTAAIQEQQAIIETLKARLDAANL